MKNCVVYKKTNLTYYSYGAEGEVLVFLHGFLENSTMWKDVIKEFSPAFRIICIDLLGHGESECLGYTHTMEEMAEAVNFILESLNINNITLIGHSMGGYVAIAFAEKFTKKINKLCLLNSTTKPDTKERRENRVRAIKMAKTNYKALVSMSISNLFTVSNKELIEKEIIECREEALKTSIQGYIACSEGMKIRTERSHVLKEATFPKLIMAGKRDTVLSYEDVLVECDETNTPLITLPNGHMSHIEDSKPMLKALTGFVKS